MDLHHPQQCVVFKKTQAPISHYHTSACSALHCQGMKQTVGLICGSIKHHLSMLSTAVGEKSREKQRCLLQSERCLKPQSAGSRLFCVEASVWGYVTGVRGVFLKVLVRSERCEERSGFSWTYVRLLSLASWANSLHWSYRHAAEQMMEIWIGCWDLSNKALVYYWTTQRFGFSPLRSAKALCAVNPSFGNSAVFFFLRGKVFAVPPNSHVASLFQLEISGSGPVLYYLSFCNWHSTESGLLSAVWPKIEKQFVLIFFQLRANPNISTWKLCKGKMLWCGAVRDSSTWLGLDCLWTFAKLFTLYKLSSWAGTLY